MPRRRDCSEGTVSDRRIRIRQIYFVKDIKDLCPELKRVILLDGEIFEDREIDSRETRTGEGIARCSSICAQSRVCEGRRIEPLHTANRLGNALIWISYLIAAVSAVPRIAKIA